MNAYQLLKKKQSEEFSKFPMFFAFNDKQFEEGMKKLGLLPTDTDKVYRISAGGYYRKTDSTKLKDLFDRFDSEMKSAINDEISGENFCYEMFSSELANHEYGYTDDLEESLDAVGCTVDEINANKNLLAGLKRALGEYKQ